MDEQRPSPLEGIRSRLLAARRRSQVEPRPVGAQPVASSSQRRLWFLDRLVPQDPAYNESNAYELEGPLDVDLLQRSLALVVQRHDVLRTTFTDAGGVPVPTVLEHVPVELPCVDLTDAPQEKAIATAARLAGECARTAFSLSTAPLFRFTLFRLAERRHILQLTVHHTVWDQGSLAIFLHELEAAYAAMSGGEEPDLPPITLQFADYAAWEAEFLEANEDDSGTTYWKRALEGACELLELPKDFDSDHSLEPRSATHWLTLGPDVSRAVDRCAAHANVTPFVVLLAAYAVLISRIANQKDFQIGIPVAHRDRQELRAVVGMLTNSIPLRCDLSDDPSFESWLARLSRHVSEAMEHAVLPFERIVQSLGARRDAEHNPLFQVMFTYYPHLDHGRLGPAVRRRVFTFELGTARFDLELYLWRSGGEIAGKFVFPKTIDPENVASWARALIEILCDADRHPEAPTSRSWLMSERDAAASRHLGHGARTTYPRDRSIGALFRERASGARSAPALSFSDDVWTYERLDEASDRIARHLVAHGTPRGAPVGILAAPSPATIAGILGILECGACYVPFDPTHPVERIRTLVRNARIETVLATTSSMESAEDVGAHVLRVEELLASDAPHVTLPIEDPDGDRAAYAMFTSGSSGTPKAVVVPQRAIARLVLATDYVDLHPDDRVAMASNLSFDASTFEIFGALLNGACLVSLPRDVLLHPRALRDALRQERITTLFLTSALFHAIALETPDAFSSLRQVLYGGERIPNDGVAAVLSAGPPARLLHVYGPTENTTFSTWHLVTSDDLCSRSRIPIGQPIANTDAHVLDEWLRPVPDGIPGELHLGGDGLAIGYLDDELATGSAFVDAPSYIRGERLYRTGDLVRRRADGLLEFLRRSDHQVKVRGFRIEPEEIESALRSHPRVDDAMVIADRTPQGNRLIALVVPAQEDPPTIDELRQHLRSRLPEYMLPTSYIPVETIPLTTNGKRDRRLRHGEIAALIETRLRSTPERAAPRNALEATLVHIWRDVLWLDHEPGIHDDFFELGGHSLLAVELITKIERSLDRELPVAAFFRLRSVAALAAYLDEVANPPTGIQATVDAPSEPSDAPRLLIIDASLPYDDRDSGSRRLYSLLRILRDMGCSVTFLPDNGIAAEPYASRLRALGVELLLDDSPHAPRGERTREESLLDRLPRVDVVWICKPPQFETYGELARRLGSVKVIYDTIDLHFLRLRRARRARGLTPTEDWKAMRTQELGHARRADVTFTVTDDEKEHLERAGIENVIVMPNVHEVRARRASSFRDRHGVLFIGSYRHAPNVDAAIWLCEAIMPRVWKRRPDIHLTLLGSSPNQVVRSLANDRVTVTGFVPLVEPFFDSHRVFAAPLTYGAGMKGKIGQSIELGLPVVTTPIGIEGMNLAPRRDVLVGRSARRLANAILRLHEDETLWTRLSRNAEGKLRECHPDRIEQRLHETLQRLGVWRTRTSR